MSIGSIFWQFGSKRIYIFRYDLKYLAEVMHFTIKSLKFAKNSAYGKINRISRRILQT